MLKNLPTHIFRNGIVVNFRHKNCKVIAMKMSNIKSLSILKRDSMNDENTNELESAELNEAVMQAKIEEFLGWH